VVDPDPQTLETGLETGESRSDIDDGKPAEHSVDELLDLFGKDFVVRLGKGCGEGAVDSVGESVGQAPTVIVEDLGLSAVALGFDSEQGGGGLVEELGMLLNVATGCSPVGGGDEFLKERSEVLDTLAYIPRRHKLVIEFDKLGGDEVRGGVLSQHGRRNRRWHHVRVGIGELVADRCDQRSDQVGNGLARERRPVGGSDDETGSRCAPHEQDRRFEVGPATGTALVGERGRVGGQLVVVDVEHDDDVELTRPPTGQTDHGAQLAPGGVGAHRDSSPG
jgi:hypothetical protein